MKIQVKHIDKIEGCISISGSKNIALPIICACLLSNKTINLKNVPIITDVTLLIEILKEIGCKIAYNKKTKILKIKAKNISSTVLSTKVRNLRGSYYIIGSLLSRFNKCIIGYPGGCNFSTRPIDYHIDVFNQLGYRVKEINDFVFISNKNVNNYKIKIKEKSVGASINALLSCVCLKEVYIDNILFEPEVLEVINFLRILGKKIDISDNGVIMHGQIQQKTFEYTIPSDRIEAGSYMLLACGVKNSNLKIVNAPIKYINSVVKLIRDLGVNIKVVNDDIYICKTTKIKNVNIIVKEYPSFPTDLQQILSVILLDAESMSTIKDYIYRDRISQINELKKMGGEIEFINDTINIYPSVLVGSDVICKDLRCSFALLVAGIMAIGKTNIDKFELAFRGYEEIVQKMINIGIDIKIYY